MNVKLANTDTVIGIHLLQTNE